ncbi:MAG: dihydrofolate reductase [Treponema sp.]|nr:dihydrofolate reductase [Treponema sp.]
MKMILYMAVSIDGIAALDDEHGIEEYGSPEDRDFFLGRAKKCGAVVMGRKTARHKVGGVPNIVLTHSAKDCRGKPDNDTGARDNDSGADGRIYMSGSAQEVYDKIAAMGFKKVALLGGPATNEQFLRAGLVDEIFLTVEPVTIGRGIHFANQPLETRWTLAGVKKLNKQGTLVLHYKAR